MYSDRDLARLVEDLKRRITSWAESKDLYPDYGFKSWYEHFEDEPRGAPVVLLLWFENELTHDMNLQDELQELVNSSTSFTWRSRRAAWLRST